MMKHDHSLHTHDCKCFTWKPIVAGALIIIGLSFLLNLFSVAIGLTAFSTSSDGIEKLAFSGLIATALGLIVSMFAAGWITGYLGNRYCVKRHLGALYGFLAWCLALIITVFLATHVQQYINFYTHSLSGTTMSMSTTMAKGGAEVAVNAPQTHVVISTYILFTLFFLSAFAASLGGHYGMRYINRDERTHI